jgi:hypothetical protein
VYVQLAAAEKLVVEVIQTILFGGVRQRNRICDWWSETAAMESRNKSPL